MEDRSISFVYNPDDEPGSDSLGSKPMDHEGFRFRLAVDGSLEIGIRCDDTGAEIQWELSPEDTRRLTEFLK
jgi:hypothetical protein